MLQIEPGAPQGAPGDRLERDVVFGTAPAPAGAGCGPFEVGGVGRDVAGRREAPAPTVAIASAPGAVAGAEELDRVGDDLDGLAFAAAVFGLPLTPVEPAFDRDRAALGQVVGAVLALAAEDDDVEVVGLVDPLAALVFAAAVDRDAELTDGRPTPGVPQLGIPRQVPGDDHHIHVRSCQSTHSSEVAGLNSSLRAAAA